jgi:hypothetical protein
VLLIKLLITPVTGDPVARAAKPNVSMEQTGISLIRCSAVEAAGTKLFFQQVSPVRNETDVVGILLSYRQEEQDALSIRSDPDRTD